jgi:hypothetical protein
MLEAQLCRNSSSLEAYLDRTTLKVRLGKIASAITSHYKQAIQTHEGSRGSVLSTSDFGSLEEAFSMSQLRRLSAESVPMNIPTAPLPKRRQSEPTVTSSSPMPRTFLTKLRPEGSDSVLQNVDTRRYSASSKSSAAQIPANATTTFGNKNNNDHFKKALQQNNNPGVSNGTGGIGMNAMKPQQQQQPNNVAVQQQILAKMQLQQQQHQMARAQMNINGQPNNAMMGAPMMGNNGMAMMNQQQHAAMMMQQQHTLLQQQQQQQQRQGMPNMGLGFPQQQAQNPMFMNNGMNMMMNTSGPPNVSPGSVGGPNVIPGVGRNVLNFNTPAMLARDTTTMQPPPALSAAVAAAAAAATAGNPPRQGSAGNDERSPLSPGSFEW